MVEMDLSLAKTSKGGGVLLIRVATATSATQACKKRAKAKQGATYYTLHTTHYTRYTHYRHYTHTHYTLHNNIHYRHYTHTHYKVHNNIWYFRAPERADSSFVNHWSPTVCCDLSALQTSPSRISALAGISEPQRGPKGG